MLFDAVWVVVVVELPRMLLPDPVETAVAVALRINVAQTSSSVVVPLEELPLVSVSVSV